MSVKVLRYPCFYFDEVPNISLILRYCGYEELGVELCSAAPSVPQTVFTITEKAPTRALSWLKAPTSAFTFKTLLRHYAKQELTPR